MAELHLENVPDDLVCQIEQLAQRQHRTPAETAISLLQEAVSRCAPAGRRTVQEILDHLARNRFRPDPGGPDVVEMLREDRNR
jgi:hypothetical protein